MTEIFPFFLFYFGLKLLQRISGLQAILLQFLPKALYILINFILSLALKNQYIKFNKAKLTEVRKIKM